MRALFRRQSELSAASAAFYFLGGVICLLALTVFYDATNPLNIASLTVGVLAFVISGLYLLAGDRAELRSSLLLMCVSGMLVLVLVSFSRYEVRAMGSGLLFYTFFIYLAWFGRMRLARVIGYAWLAGYCIVMAIKFDTDILQFLTTLTLTAVILGELVGRFKHRLEVTSITDPLCGVWNKRGVEQILDRAVRVVHRTGRPLSVLFFDLDDFKGINDSRGHREGDRVLCKFAAQLEANTRPQDTLARLGGDEFILVLPDTRGEQAEELAVRLRRIVSAATWSCGWAELAPGESADALVARADEMMLENKRGRKAVSAAGPGSRLD